MKIGKNLRNLIMKQTVTVMLSKNKAQYLGEIYTFEPVTYEDTFKIIKHLRELLR